MIKLFSAQKAYSLIELTVSLAIISILLTMSTIGLISLREGLLLNSATQGVYDAVQLARSYAINNVTYWNTDSATPEIPTMYVITLGSPISLMYCNLPTNTAISDINVGSDCALTTGSIFDSDIGSVSINNNLTNGCEAVGFLTGTGEMYVKQLGSSNKFYNSSNLNGATQDKAICDFAIQNVDSINPRTVYIESDGNRQTIKKK
ncbi:MAG: type II secretion system protein [bacterium]